MPEARAGQDPTEGVVIQDTAPGPCYPNYPDMHVAFAVHRRDAATDTCCRCGVPW